MFNLNLIIVCQELILMILEFICSLWFGLSKHHHSRQKAWSLQSPYTRTHISATSISANMWCGSHSVMPLPELVKQVFSYTWSYMKIEKKPVRWMRYKIESALVLQHFYRSVSFDKPFITKASSGLRDSVSEPSRVYSPECSVLA